MGGEHSLRHACGARSAHPTRLHACMHGPVAGDTATHATACMHGIYSGYIYDPARCASMGSFWTDGRGGIAGRWPAYLATHGRRQACSQMVIPSREESLSTGPLAAPYELREGKGCACKTLLRPF
jgi:hypothetical protein